MYLKIPKEADIKVGTKYLIVRVYFVKTVTNIL